MAAALDTDRSLKHLLDVGVVSMPMWFCPECYTTLAERGPCACNGVRRETQHILLGAPGEAPAIIGHLTLLDDTPRPWHLLEGLCDGPRRYPYHVPADSNAGCWRHKARTVWVWQQSAESLPRPGVPPGRDCTETVLLRAMEETSLLLLEAPQGTTVFRARYARNRTPSLSPPGLAEIIDRLLWSFDLFTSRRRVIALLDPNDTAGAEDHLRLRGMSAAFELFKERDKAFRWLLERTAQVAATPMPAVHRATAVQAVSRVEEYVPSGKSGVSAKGKRREGELERRPDSVRVVDVGGGGAARNLLAQLHRATWTAVEADEKAGGTRGKTEVRLPSPRWPSVQLQAYCTAEGLRYGRLHQLPAQAPPPGSHVPSWAGLVRRWWWKTQPFTVALEGEAAAEGSPLIIGVGPSRLLGESELAALLDRVWQGNWAPAAIIRAAQYDDHLFGWVRSEFPRLLVFPGSREGELRALETALHVARRRERL